MSPTICPLSISKLTPDSASFEPYALPVSKGARIEAASLGNQAAMYGCAYEALRLRKERFGQEEAE